MVNINSRSQVKHIVIVGGGPAGSSIAIRLAQQNFSVTLIEREKFPREKLCGEFISPECLRHFRELGVFDKMLSAGGDRITETHFYAVSGKSIAVPSDWFDGGDAALSLSRAEMDFQLLQRARTVGVEVIEEASVVGLEENALKVRHKNGDTDEVMGDLFIDATGRSRILSKLVQKRSQKPKTKDPKQSLVGFKAHLRGVRLDEGRCEIYSFQDGYCGLSNIENGLANLCMLVRSSAVRKYNSDVDAIVHELLLRNKRAFETLANAKPVHDWIAVAVDRFGMSDLNPGDNVLTVGDAAAFIDPFTGSGMLMAFEGAELLADCVVKSENLEGVAAKYAMSYQRRFADRLNVGGMIRRVAFMPRSASFLILLLSFSRAARGYLARATRQSTRRRTNKS
ncbi:MAG TPA: NAD(P)/FAD-dependent oxidoreductase [Pyrinomonadaceae bacterium]|nr:NAD(P)/FAD-dependent oxidoreductase [Pyrinomonadaceae bacterium]